MSKYEKEILKDIRKRLKTSNPKKWQSLTEEQQELAVITYYQIRDTDYQNISYLLREHASERKQFLFLMLGIGFGVFANPISTILLKYFPSRTIVDDISTILIFTGLLVLCGVLFMKASAQSLDDENVLERLVRIGEESYAETRDSEAE